MIGEFLQRTYYDNRVLDYILFVAILIIGSILIYIFKTIVLRRLKEMAAKTKTTIDDFFVLALRKKILPLFYLALLYVSFKSLNINQAVVKAFTFLGVIVVTIYAAQFVLDLIMYVLDAYWIKSKKPAKDQTLRGMHTVIRFGVWVLAIIILLDNLGIKISALVAGLGITGIAVALAAQAVLGDLFSYFTIFFDRPFEVGDFIIMDDYMGVIEYIGIKTTRIRSLGGEQLIFSNTDLTSSRVRNYKRMEKRRVLFKLGVTYQTTHKQMKEIPGILKNIINSVNNTAFDRTHFSSYGDFSLVVEVVYYVLSADYNKYMDIQQEINFKIKEEFEKRSIEFAYPTQTVFVSK